MIFSPDEYATLNRHGLQPKRYMMYTDRKGRFFLFFSNCDHAIELVDLVSSIITRVDQSTVGMIHRYRRVSWFVRVKRHYLSIIENNKKHAIVPGIQPVRSSSSEPGSPFRPGLPLQYSSYICSITLLLSFLQPCYILTLSY